MQSMVKQSDFRDLDIGFYTENPVAKHIVQKLHELEIQRVAALTPEHKLVLTNSTKGIALLSRSKALPGEMRLDFAGGVAEYRRLQAEGQGQALAKAIGVRKLDKPTVIDATAGLGRDAFVLATLGCLVTLLERSRTLYFLLWDAAHRAAGHAVLAEWFELRFNLVYADALQYLDNLKAQQYPDVIYLDPMYPSRSKSALVKKELRFIRALVGDDMDSAALLSLALQRSKKRVVVKRPKSAELLPGPKPSHEITSKNTRYDIYQIP